METPKRVCLYLRVSTDNQSTDNQLLELKKACELRGWPIADVFRDVLSGKTTSRPELDRMMDLLRKRRYDCLMVWAFDRFTRNTVHAIMTMNELRELGINFVSLKQGIDTTTIMGKAMFGIIAIFAEMEREQIQERVRAGVARVRGCKHCRHGQHFAMCLVDVPTTEGSFRPCNCTTYAPLKIFGRAGWKKDSSKRGPAVVAPEIYQRVLAMRGTASQRTIAAQLGISQATVARMLIHKPPQITVK